MRAKNNRRRRGGGGTDYWLCFSDLMSTLVLVLVLIMFYSLYQHFDAIEAATARNILQQQQLEEKESALASQNEELEISRQALIEQQAQLNSAQAALEEAQKALAVSQMSVEEKEALLAAQETLLKSQQDQMDSQQSLLVSQQAQMAQQQTQLDELVGIRSKIVVELAAALKQANVQVVTDPKTGSITLSSEVLFGYNESELSAEGRNFLAKFIPVYMDVLLSDEYSDKVSELIIEGHTDSTGSYVKNMELSQSRARAVLDFVLSSDFIGLNDAQKQKLQAVVTVNGRSWSDPVLDDNGLEDQDASRRVEFKFRLHDETMIEQMQEILNSYN